jgi:cytochrome c551/c552
MNRLYIGCYIIFAMSVLSCSSNSHDAIKEQPTTLGVMSENEVAGITLLNQHCFSCHTPEDNNIAPGLDEIREIYVSHYPEKIDFIGSITNFVNHPVTEKALMPSSVKKQGLMPAMYVTKSELDIMLSYLYDRGSYAQQLLADLKALAQNPMPKIEFDYVTQGKELALATKSELGKALLSTIQEKGTEQAITFCNIHALSITDSMSTVLNTSIKRVSDQPRNPKNAANEDELNIILDMKKKLQNGQSISPVIIEKTGDNPVIMGYYPIEVNDMCLQCHGHPKTDISKPVIDRIKQLYPHDQAIGYTTQEIRGLFVVEMKPH